MSDIRLQAGVTRHPKIIHLRAALGDYAALCLIELWSFTAQNHPRGTLKGMDAKAIAVASGWSGQASRFVSTLVRLRLLDQIENTFRIHDWREHQPWVFFTPERQKLARRAARASVKARTNKALHRKEQRADRSADRLTDRSTETPGSAQAPSPSPSPDQDLTPPTPPNPRASRARGGRKFQGLKPSRPGPNPRAELTPPLRAARLLHHLSNGRMDHYSQEWQDDPVAQRLIPQWGSAIHTHSEFIAAYVKEAAAC